MYASSLQEKNLLDKQLIKEIKLVRRTIKNRLYAKSGRDKRESLAMQLEVSLELLL